MNQWIAFTALALMMLCSGIVILTVILRASWGRREKDSLTALDLRALEESALLLIDQLKTEADNAAAELDKRKEELRALIIASDRILEIANRSLEPSEIARVTGLDCATIGLARNFAKKGTDTGIFTKGV
jgi:hypothetical protein